MSKEAALEYYRYEEAKIKKRIAAISKIKKGATYILHIDHGRAICDSIEFLRDKVSVRVLAKAEISSFERYIPKCFMEQGKEFIDILDSKVLNGAELFDPDQAPLIVNWGFVSGEFKTKYFKGGTNE